MSDFELHQSSLKTYLMCPKKFQFEYIEERPVPASGEVYLGSAFHYAVSEALLRTNKKIKEALTEEAIGTIFLEEMDSGESYAKLSPRWNGEILASKEELERLKQEGLGMLQNALPHLRQLNPVMIETYLRVQVDSFYCGGRIDLYDLERGLIDFKTASRRWNQERVDTNIQMTFYALLLGGATNGEMHIAVRNGGYDIFTTQRNKAQITYLKENLILPVMKQIDAGVFPACDPESWWCSEKWCPFYHLCGRASY